MTGFRPSRRFLVPCPWQEGGRFPELLAQIPVSAVATDWVGTELLFIGLIGPDVGFLLIFLSTFVHTSKFSPVYSPFNVLEAWRAVGMKQLSPPPFGFSLQMTIF